MKIQDLVMEFYAYIYKSNNKFMKKALIPVLLFCANILFSQNFQNICSHGITFFKGSDGYFNAFRQDSIQVIGNSDTLFYSYRAIRDSSTFSGQCRDTTSGDVLGLKVFKTHDGWFMFFNKMNDTIRLNSQASLNESWRFCSLPDSVDCYLEAKVTAIITDSVAGTTDLVKVISLQARNSFNNTFPNIFNQKTIKLSQHFGLSKIYDIYWTPFDTVELNLIGKTTPPTGIQPFTWADVYNYDIGDEFHYSGFQSYGSSTFNWKYINRILGKTTYGNPDSVRYHVETCRKSWYAQPPTNTTTLHDTVDQFYNFIQLSNDNELSLMPDEFSRSGWVAKAVARTFSEYNNRQVQIINSNGYLYDGGVNCYIDPFEISGPVSWYVPGLGLTNYGYCYFDYYPEQYNNELVYFKKGAETWGTPVATDCFILTGTDFGIIPVGPLVEAFPNPAGTETRILLRNSREGQKFRYVLFNYSGIKVQEGDATSNPLILLRNLLPSGLYLLTITDMNGKNAGSIKISFK